MFKPFVTVYGDHAPSQFYNGIMWSWNREQREYKERNVARHMRVRPLYRVNIRMKPCQEL